MYIILIAPSISEWPMPDYLGVCACSRRVTFLFANKSETAHDFVEHKIQWRMGIAHRNYWRKASTIMAWRVRSTH